jgi:hypothetical protein
MNNPQNEDAWLNYFFSARYGWANVKGQSNPREVLTDSIYKEMGEAVPDSWVYHYIHYYNYGTDFSRLQKAYDINPDVSDLYWEFMKEYELRGETENKKVFSEILYNSKDISKGVLNINYNMLISTESNSILFTNGDNDTYPAWILQEVKGVRDDVLILNVHAIFGDKEYLQTKLNDKGLEIDIALLPESQIDQFLLELILMIREKYSQFPIHIAQTVYEGFILRRLFTKVITKNLLKIYT